MNEASATGKSAVRTISPTRIGETEILFAQGVRAGPWLFFTSHEASDFQTGIAPSVLGESGLPFHGLPRARREGEFILSRLSSLLAAEGSDFAHAVRLDQYYPTALAVDPYHHARRRHFGKTIPPSTSVVMKALPVQGAHLDVSLMAVVPGHGLEPRRADPKDVPVPLHSGFVPSMIVGDYVFVAGQMAQDEDVGRIHPKAYRPAEALWNGTDIRLQTEFLITSRLGPALEAGGSSLANAIKAQVYLRHVSDIPDFLDVWNTHFGATPCALTIVPTEGFGFTYGIIEINIFGVRNDGKIRKQIVDVDLPPNTAFGPAAVRAGDLVCLSGLLATDAKGALPGADGGLGHYGVGATRQMRHILSTASRICEAAGTGLANVVRAHHFHTDLAEIHPALRAWNEHLPGQAIPFGSVGVTAPMPVPGCSILLDMWAYAPAKP